MRLKRSGLLVRAVILALVVYACIGIVSVRARVEEAQNSLAVLHCIELLGHCAFIHKVIFNVEILICITVIRLEHTENVYV